MSLKHDLLVLGSQNAKEEDQKLMRSEVRPVQILSKDGALKPVSFFNDWGKVGVSSIAWDERFPEELFVSINDEIRRLNVQTKQFETLELEPIGDLHDIHFLGDLLWISNTEYDEALAYDPVKREVVQRYSLSDFRWELDDIEEVEEIEKSKRSFSLQPGVQRLQW